MTLDKLLANPYLTNKQRKNIVDLFNKQGYIDDKPPWNLQGYYVNPYIVQGHFRSYRRHLKLVEKKHA